MSELLERLEREILPLVIRPSRYVGAERNVAAFEPDAGALRFLLAFPDVYEIGMSHLGLRVLYDILNRRDDVQCERCFAPWVDMEELQRERGVPLFSIESHSAASDFDVIGFTLQYELHYTTILSMIDLAGIPLRAEDRGDDAPIVIAGGPNAFNPEPVAEFFDAIVIGDGESVVLDVADALIEAKASHGAASGASRWGNGGSSRRSVLERLASIPGVYVPSLYQVTDGEGLQRAVLPVSDGAPPVVARRAEVTLGGLGLPACPIVPITEAAHDRLTLEIMRGCTRGCRFCQAGMITRPVRERPVADLVELAVEGIDRSGYDEVSLMSLSTSDYAQLGALVAALNEKLAGRKVSIALPSLRLDRFSLDLAGGVGSVRRAGLTFAPEAGSQRMRDVINKNETEEHILETVDVAFSSGWDRIKLYFMIGLPTETDEDVEAIARLVGRVRHVARGKRKAAKISVSISPFVPKSHTPFQWEAQDSPEETARKERILREKLHIKGVKCSLRDPNVSFLEGVLARGDRRLAGVVRRAYEKGARLEAWTERFEFRLWEDAFAEAGLDPTEYLAARDTNAPLPWDHIDGGPSRDFLLEERAKALRAETTPDCRLEGCFDCGACGPADATRELPPRDGGGSSSCSEAQGAARRPSGFGRRTRRARPEGSEGRWRVRFAKRGRLRFLSHLDIVRAIIRAATASGLPIAFSQGFNPHPKLSFGPPLPVGTTGDAEFFDIELTRGVSGEDVVSGLAASLPEGLDIIDATQAPGRLSITAEAEAARYTATLPSSFESLTDEETDAKLDAVRRIREVEVKRGDRTKVVRPAEGILELRRVASGAPGDGDGRGLSIVLKLGEQGAMRPLDVLDLLLDDHREALLVHVHHEELLRRRRDGNAGLEPI